MNIILKDPAPELYKLIKRSYPTLQAFYYDSDKKQLILTCTNYLNDPLSERHFIYYSDSVFQATYSSQLVIPYSLCKDIKVFKGGI